MQRKKPHTSLKRIFWRFAISALKSEHSDGVDLNESALGMLLPPNATRAGFTEPMKACAYTSSISWKSSTFFM